MLKTSGLRACAGWTVSVLLIVAMFAFVPTAAWAGQTNCNSSVNCDFTGLTPMDTITGTLSPPSGAWTGTFTENVYQKGGVYIYVFELQLTAINGGDSLSSASTGLGMSALNLFSSSLNYGMVTNVGTASGTFNFEPSTLQVNSLTGMSSTGATLAFYAESTLPPGAGQFNGLDGGVASTPALDPTNMTPEPTSLSLLGTGLLAVGAIVRKKLVR